LRGETQTARFTDPVEWNFNPEMIVEIQLLPIDFAAWFGVTPKVTPALRDILVKALSRA